MDTVGEFYDRVIKATTQAEADEQLAELIRLMVKEGKSPRAAKKIAKKNIGYWAGYYDEETARRIWRLFRTKHPVFGKRWPGPREAFQLGVKLGRKARVTNSSPRSK